MGTAASPQDRNDLLTIDEAAALLGRSRALVEARINDGALPVVEGLRRKKLAKLVPREALEGYQRRMGARMTALEARRALGLKSYEGLRVLVEKGDLDVEQIAGRPTYARTEVERLAKERAERLPLQQAADRAGLSRTVFRARLEQMGGTVIQRAGGRARFRIADVDKLRQQVVPDGSIDASEAAKILGISLVETRRLAHAGDLPSLVRPYGPKGWRFSREDVLAFKRSREGAAMRSVLDLWSTSTTSASVERRDGGLVHHARNQVGADQAGVNGLNAAWQVW
ncbi:TPA: helix-turn-helix domain-containing protein [Burkholderia vietnamiensis]|nr:helix-turn-helix domain-containing protein [Burkholderia vietnamiensis]